MSLSEKLKAARVLLGSGGRDLSQERMAGLLGVTTATYCSVEHGGRRSHPGTIYLLEMQLARVLAEHREKQK